MAYGGWSCDRATSSSHQPFRTEDGDEDYGRRRLRDVARGRLGSRPIPSRYARAQYDVDPNIAGARPKTYPHRSRVRQSDRPQQASDPTQDGVGVSRDIEKPVETTRKKHLYEQKSPGGFVRSGDAGESYELTSGVPLDGGYGSRTSNTPDDQFETTHQSRSSSVWDTGSQEDWNKNAPTCDNSVSGLADDNTAELQGKLDTTVQGRTPGPYQVKPKTKVLPLTVKQLQELLKSDPSIVLSELVKSKNEFIALLDQDQISNTTIHLIIQVLSILWSLDPVSVHIKELNVVLTMVESSSFLTKHLTRFLVVLPTDEIDDKDDNDIHGLGKVVKVLRLFLQNKPNSYSEIGGALILLERIIMSDCLMAEFQQLKISYNTVEQAQRTAKERASEKPPPNNFRDIQIFPDSREIRQVTKPFLRKNIIRGRYENVEHYLDVQFRLLREDFVAPLREGVTEFLSDTSSGLRDIRIYKDVSILKQKMCKGSLVYTLAFDTKPFKRFNWESSKRLQYGSFVCLTRDKFRNIICATVENSTAQELALGRVDVRFLNETCNLSNGPYIMAESAAYFEACRYVLHGLQQINEQNFPFKKYIVEVASTVDPPAYLKASGPFLKSLRARDKDGFVTYDLGLLDTKSSTAGKIPILNFDAWPSAEDLHMDESQKAALQTALTKEFAIIQGPPGTGKTYIGLKIVQLLLRNVIPRYRSQFEIRKGVPSRAPILVVCYTNHALDQFLEGIHHFSECQIRRDKDGIRHSNDCQIIRVGGRCKSEVLKYRNLSKMRQHRRIKMKSHRYDVHTVLRQLRENEEEIRPILLKIELPTKVLLNVKVLKEFMTNSEYRALLMQHQKDKKPEENPQKLLKWLGIVEERNKQTMKDKIFLDNAAYDLRCSKRCGENRDMKPVEELQKPDVMTDNEANGVGRVWSLTILDRWRLYRLWIKRYLEDHKEELQRQHQIHDDLSKQLEAVKMQNGAFQKRGRGSWKDPRKVEMDLRATAEAIQWLLLKIELPNKVLLNDGALKRYMDHSEYGALFIHHRRDQEPQHDPQKLLNWLGVVETNERIQVEDERHRIHMEREDYDSDEDTQDEEWLSFTEQQIYRENGAYIPTCTMHCGQYRDVDPISELQKPDAMTKKEAESVERVWALQIQDRWRLYRLWVNRYVEEFEKKLQEKRQEHKNLSKRLQSINRKEDFDILSEAKVIGMTTTGAAKNWTVLQQLCPRIVVVEEAAEVLEAHIITSLTKKCQHLILIGDHQQLKPNPTVYRLAKRFNLDTSLFERMINNGVPCQTLTHQHRMRPEISNVMKKHFYKNLQDDESVLKMDNIKGVAHNMFFVDHQYFESERDESKSKSNQYEAEFLVGLCKYLLQQDYDPSQITILTAYTGQLFCFRRLMNEAIFEGVRVCVVDNFQGEENDIILLSLVRSNEAGSIGFLSTSNRVCVALSRARIGFYCIGNGSMLKKTKKTKLWEDILASLEAENQVGNALPLVCPNHPNKVNLVISKEDFIDRVPLGGCDAPCEFRLSCGHVCTLRCHGFDLDHVKYKCKKPCVRTCDRQHPCPLPCNKKCKCLVKLTKTMPDCGHEIQVPCHEFDECKCFVELTKTMPHCGHVIEVHCHEFDSVTCPKPCQRLCQDNRHQCEELCGESCLQRCPRKCERVLPCGHPCRKTCGDICTQYCEVRVKKDLPKCNHRAEVLCSEDPEGIICQEKCDRMLKCGHPCEELCGKPCTTHCLVQVQIDLPECNHRAEALCWEDPEDIICQEKCERMLECGHPCDDLCGHVCTTFCRVEVERTLPKCGHTVAMKCGAQPNENESAVHRYLSGGKDPYVCKERCEKMLECGHRCPNVCGLPCTQSEIDKLRTRYCSHRSYNKMDFKTCDKPVGKTYTSCGHHVTVPCHKPLSEVPCRMHCEKLLSCGHRCPRMCNEKCPPENIDDRFIFLQSRMTVGNYLLTRCQKKCDKDLPCGHKCPNKCGEPCPTVNLNAMNRFVYTECQEEVEKKLPGCDHYATVRCSVDVNSFICSEKCEKVLPCGHGCPRKCSEVCPKRQENEEIFLTGVLRNQRDIRAYLSSVCREKCQRELACGHKCPNKCGEPCPQEKSVATRKYLRGIMTKCHEEVKKKLPRCDHYVSARCSKDVSSFICREKCDKVLPCGHRCPNKCIEPCPGDGTFQTRATRWSKNYGKRTGPRERCEVVVEKDLPCGHKKKAMPCWKAESAVSKTCNIPCNAVLKCGHRCTGNCNSCKQGTQHKLCSKICNRQLVCGHSCTGSCGTSCSPDCRRCRDDPRQDTSEGLTSSSPCKHNVRHRYLKTNACFRPCSQKLRCRHPCIGVCGEPCPPYCNVCDKKSVRTNVPKGEFHPRGQYIYLPDCKHLCLMQSLDRTVAASKNTLERGCFQIRDVLCPKCKQPIRNCSRYDDFLRVIRESTDTARQICSRSNRASQKNGAATTTPLSFSVGKWMRCRRGHVFYLEEEGGRMVGDRQESIICPECLKQKGS